MNLLYKAIRGSDIPYTIAERGKIAGYIDLLSPEEQLVLYCRYGIGRPKLTLVQTGEVIGKSASRARQLEAFSLRKIRDKIKADW